MVGDLVGVDVHDEGGAQVQPVGAAPAAGAPASSSTGGAPAGGDLGELDHGAGVDASTSASDAAPVRMVGLPGRGKVPATPAAAAHARAARAAKLRAAAASAVADAAGPSGKVADGWRRIVGAQVEKALSDKASTAAAKFVGQAIGAWDVDRAVSSDSTGGGTFNTDQVAALLLAARDFLARQRGE